MGGDDGNGKGETPSIFLLGGRRANVADLVNHELDEAIRRASMAKPMKAVAYDPGLHAAERIHGPMVLVQISPERYEWRPIDEDSELYASVLPEAVCSSCEMAVLNREYGGEGGDGPG